MFAPALGVSGAGADSPPPPKLKSSRISPKRAFFDSVRGVRISFRLKVADPVTTTVRIKRSGTAVRRFRLPGVESGVRQVVVWDGITSSGKAPPDGGYRVFIDTNRGPAMRAGRFVLHGHFFPVRGPHGTRGAIGEFGAPRSGGRTHEGFDVTAKCGTPLAAVRAGKVTHRGYDPELYGNFIEIKGRKERRSYFYAHLPKPANPKKGELLKTGERIGRVGRTGNAADVPGCHLHFEIHHHGHPIDPEPDLRAWDKYS